MWDAVMVRSPPSLLGSSRVDSFWEWTAARNLSHTLHSTIRGQRLLSYTSRRWMHALWILTESSTWSFPTPHFIGLTTISLFFVALPSISFRTVGWWCLAVERATRQTSSQF